MKYYLLYIWYKYIGAIFRIMPIKNNRVLLVNFFGKGYGDNPKYIAEELLSRNDINLELIWLVKGKYYDDIPKEIKQVKRGTLKELYYLSTAKVWVDNSRKHAGIVKRKKQYYIQTWHGDLGLKMIEKDVENAHKKSYIKSAKADSKMIDLITSGSEMFSNTVKRAFWYNGRILECGSPKTDAYFNINAESKNSYRTVIYAPTFRDSGDNSCCNIDYNKLIDTLNEKYNCDWKVIVRFHPNVSYLQENITYTDRIINGSKYSDINEMIRDCDMLITDYSSTAFDAMYANKKVLLFIPDAEEYFKIRKSYFTMDELPFPKAKSNEELFKNIKELNEVEYFKRINQFLRKINSFERGTASKAVADEIIRVINLK